MKCINPACGETPYALGFCRYHYGRERRNGDGATFMPGSVTDRFWGHVQKSDGCWEWISSTNIPNGYGCFYVGQKKILAHIYSFELHFGSTNGLLVCHKCDNKRCVRPDHFFLGTHADNTNDAISKGIIKHPNPLRGADCPWSKLNAEIVRDLRARYAQGGISYQKLAAEVGVSEMTVLRAVKGESWTHI